MQLDLGPAFRQQLLLLGLLLVRTVGAVAWGDEFLHLFDPLLEEVALARQPIDLVKKGLVLLP
eukprot:3202010-Lingulodinium_polyedra.AAC.1